MEPSRIAIADAQYLTRVGLRHILSSATGLVIAGESSNDLELMAMLNQEPVDVVIMDYNQPGRFSPETIARLRALDDSPAVVVISEDNDKSRIFSVLEAGVGCFLTRECDDEEILDAIKAALRGDKFFCTKILDFLIEESLGKAPRRHPSGCGATPLSPREVEIVRLVAKGMVAKEIAMELHLSTHTVYTHRKNIMRKLDLAATSELVRYALDQGWVD